MSAQAPRTALGFDYGEKRIGVAVGQTVTRTASPLTTLPAKQGQPDWVVLGRLIAEWQPDCLVLGMPSTADGQPHPMAEPIARFGRRLGGRYNKPVHVVDERLSSYAAEDLARRSGRGLDAHAAQQILETWLNQQPPARSPL